MRTFLSSIWRFLFLCHLFGVPVLAVAQDATVIVANAEAIVAAAPDTNLAKDFLDAVGETKLGFEQFKRSNKLGPQGLAAALVALAAPDPIDNYDAKGTRITVSPVEDFGRFVDAIDYGEVLRRDDESRIVRVRVDVAEVAIDKLLDRAGDDEESMEFARRLLFSADTPSLPDKLGIQGFSRMPALRGFRDDEPEPTSRLSGTFETGDYAEVDLGGRPFAARVQEVEQKKLGGPVASLRFDDLKPIERLVRDRRMRTRLRKAGSLTLWVPTERLRKLAGPPAKAPEERTWTDVTGKFEVVATYEGVDDGKVTLARANGKKTRVPLAKLSDADRQYVEELQAASTSAANPFEEQGKTVPRSLRADWSGVKEVRSRTFRRWEFNPPMDDPPAPVKPAVSSLEVTRPDELGPFAEKLQRLFVATNGSAAVVLLEAGKLTKRRNYLQFLDFRAGRSESLIELPTKSLVLDVAPEQRLVLLKEGRFGSSQSTRLYVKRITEGGLEDVADWDAQPPDAFHKGLDDARVLVTGRVMTRTNLGPWVVWDAAKAKALYRFEFGNVSNDGVTLGPRRRYVIADAAKAVVVIDTMTGEHVASMPHTLGSLNSISVNAEMTRMSVGKHDFTIGVDMTSGEVLHGVQGSLITRGRVDFVGDLILVDHKYLLEPNYPLLLWQYQMASSPRESTHATVRAGRMWYSARHPGLGRQNEGPWAVTSIATPHQEVNAMLAALGDFENLVILHPGEEIAVEADSDLDSATTERLIASVSKALTDSGYKVVDDDGRDDLLHAVAICKKADRPIKVKVHDHDAKPPGMDLDEMKKWRGGGPPQDVAWWLKERTLTPYSSYVAIRRGEEYLWGDGTAIQPGQVVHPFGNESIDQCLQRLSTPNVERLEKLSFPGRICRRGKATAAGAYGLSLLDADGIAENSTGE